MTDQDVAALLDAHGIIGIWRNGKARVLAVSVRGVTRSQAAQLKLKCKGHLTQVKGGFNWTLHAERAVVFMRRYAPLTTKFREHVGIVDAWDKVKQRNHSMAGGSQGVNQRGRDAEQALAGLLDDLNVQQGLPVMVRFRKKTTPET